MIDQDQEHTQLGDFSRIDNVDANSFVERLDVMHALNSFQIYKQETFDLMRLVPGLNVADIGCGTGDDLRKIAQQISPGGYAVGFDLSKSMIEEARQRHVSFPSISFQNAPANALGVQSESFNAIRADRVLIHVPKPETALKEMIRVTRSGGRVVVSEPDMPGCWVANSDHAFTNRIMQSIATSCVNPYIARDLYAMFHDAGLKEISLSMRSVTAFDPESVNTILDFQSVLRKMCAQKIFSENEVVQWLTEFKERGRTGRFVAGVSIIIVAGTKE